MKCTYGQAGVDIAISDVIIESADEGISFINTEDENQYISFQDLRSMLTVNSGTTDMNNDQFVNHLTIDIGSYYNESMFVLDAPDLDINLDFSCSSIHVSGTGGTDTAIGSFNVDNLSVTSLKFCIGAHPDSGIDFEYSQQLGITSLSYNYNASKSLTLSGITFADTFSGDAEDPSSWIPTGSFTLGNVAAGNPASFDIGTDDKERTYVAFNLPMSGSVRISNIALGGTDFGPIAIDGIKVEKFLIEIPGRGFGRP
jgi:hypothetical protein